MKQTEDGAVMLKSIKSINETSNNRALEKVELLVTEFRYKENIRQPTRRLSKLQHAKSPLNLIDEDTQLTTFH